MSSSNPNDAKERYGKQEALRLFREAVMISRLPMASIRYDGAAGTKGGPAATDG